MSTMAIPRAFVWRRLHSLMGLWLVLFLCEHLLTNSQAALWLGDNGKGFVSLVNGLHNLPYLEVIELTLLGVPILIHMILGVKYLMTSKMNSGRSDGTTPSLPLRRNRAYSWQRITSWILLICLTGHVVKFRFINYPEHIELNGKMTYLAPLSSDDGLPTVAQRLGVTLYDAQMRGEEKNLQLAKALQHYTLTPQRIVAATPDFGTIELLIVRNTFKQPIYLALYTIFVLSACFHAANGFWTFLITWGWVLKAAAQRTWTRVSALLMALLIFLGMAAIWGTYFFNLRH